VNRTLRCIVSIGISALTLYACSSSARYRAQSIPRQANKNYDEGMVLKGKASYYGEKFHGRKTASGEIFNMYAMTAAHKSLPFGTKIKVTNTSNQKSVVVEINDRGPFVGNRILDLSYQAAREIGMLNSGIADVSIKIIRLGSE
jgi:rare lipoprotein A